MSEAPPPISDRDRLIAWRRNRNVESMLALMQRYGALVYASAHRRTGGDETRAKEITRAVFLVLARRARKLPRKTVLVTWLFSITALAARKARRRTFRPWPWQWFHRARRALLPADATLWARIAPELDRTIDVLPPKQRATVLLHVLLNVPPPSAARILHTTERRILKRTSRGLKRVARHLAKRSAPIEMSALAAACSSDVCAQPIPVGLAEEIEVAIRSTLGKRPSYRLARRILNSLALTRWRRRVVIGIPCTMALLAVVGATAWHIDSRSGHSRSLARFLEWSVRLEAKTVPGLAAAAKPWPSHVAATKLDAARARSHDDIYRVTNIWLAHLTFSHGSWKALQPKRIAPLPHFLQGDGSALLRNPEAQRSGIAGVLGFDFDWVKADIEFGGVLFTNVAARIKGNGTFLSSLFGEKRAFKIDLNKFTKGQQLCGADELTFNNLVVDRSFMSDALGYEFFRDAEVPSPRTAYAYLTISVPEKWDRKPLGLYAMIEPVDEHFAASRFSSRQAPIFKPVTYELFKYLGDDWAAYEEIYDLKTEATLQQRRRLIDFAQLLSQANDADFASRVGEFLDLDAFARFLAGQVMLANYDGLLANGQNFYVYLHPRSEKFGFIPWDLDLAWGGFFLMGTTEERERASIWHPWVGENRFLERMMSVAEFRKQYRAQLEDFSTRLFVRERLFSRIDELARNIREPVAAESNFRLNKFDEAVTDNWDQHPPRGGSHGANRPAHQLKRFIEKRAYFVRQQLDGKSKGMILRRKK